MALTFRVYGFEVQRSLANGDRRSHASPKIAQEGLERLGLEFEGYVSKNLWCFVLSMSMLARSEALIQSDLLWAAKQGATFSSAMSGKRRAGFEPDC